jgi:hypothetical protein
MENETNTDYDPINWEQCEHERGETFDSDCSYNFCPWCGKDLRKEKTNDTLSRANGADSQRES